MGLLNPPYDGHAVWHEHCFRPYGHYWPEDGVDELSRYDAVEDRLGRIFVWDVKHQRAIVLCDSRETARWIATRFASC